MFSFYEVFEFINVCKFLVHLVKIAPVGHFKNNSQINVLLKLSILIPTAEQTLLFRKLCKHLLKQIFDSYFFNKTPLNIIFLHIKFS